MLAGANAYLVKPNTSDFIATVKRLLEGARRHALIPHFSNRPVGVLKKEFDRGGRLQLVLNRYLHAQVTQLAQVAACNRLHDMNERLARWLLTVHDRVESDQFPITHDFMARMLGANRATVSLTAATIQQAGYIRYTRGKLTILNREGLEETSCDCYRVVKKRYEDILDY